jgi:hypothetical protein
MAGGVQRIAEADRRGGLALAGRGRADAGDQYQRAVRPRLEGADEIEANLGLEPAERFQRLGRNAGAGGDLDNRAQRDLPARACAAANDNERNSTARIAPVPLDLPA